MRRRSIAALLLLFLAAAPASRAQGLLPASPPRAGLWSLDLTIDDVGIGLGNSRHVDGLRLNFRDFVPFMVHGISVTVWAPAKGAGGEVVGLALGLPLTGAGTLRGLGLGFGLSAEGTMDGLHVALFGAGAGGGLRGVFAGGLGLGTGGDLTGIALGGLGLGAGGDVTGLVVGGLGVGAGGQVRGILVGGLGVGAGGDITGLALALGGVGAGGTLRGLAVAGLGVGAGGGIEGVAIAGLGAGSPRVRGLLVALAAGGKDVAGFALAPAYFQIEPEGSMTGVSISLVNRIRGEQHGLAIGLVNYTPSLHGVQIGLVNYAGNNPAGLKILPVLNAHFD